MPCCLQAKSGMSDLFGRIRHIREKAEVSEQMVQEITRDIKSLDYAKRHLTTSITTLNHLHMLVGGVDSLTTMTEKRQNREAAHLLGAVVNVLEHFDRYTEIDKVRDIARKVEEIQRRLGMQITQEFRKTFLGPEPDRDANASQLNEACAVLDVLAAGDTKAHILDWFIDLQLHEYRKLFHASKEEAWVDKVDRRYAWLKRTLIAYVENCGEIFPDSWRMPMHIALKFCEMTQADLSSLLQARREELDVKLLLFAIQKTTTFEQRLSAKFKDDLVEDEYSEEESGAEDEGRGPGTEPDGSAQTVADATRQKYARQQRDRERQLRREAEAKLGRRAVRRKPSPFERSISRAFEPVLDVYVAAQDAALEAMLSKFEKDFKSGLVFQEEDEGDGARVLPSAGELFLFFRNSMVQCASLSDEEPLFNLYLVFKR